MGHSHRWERLPRRANAIRDELVDWIYTRSGQVGLLIRNGCVHAILEQNPPMYFRPTTAVRFPSLAPFTPPVAAGAAAKDKNVIVLSVAHVDLLSVAAHRN